MVDTRRLEQLMSPSATADATPGVPLQPNGARRALALSGHRDIRKTGQLNPRSPQRETRIAAQWAKLEKCISAPGKDKAQTEFNLMARQSEITSRFDILRTQLLQAFRSRGLVSLGITGVTTGAGASFVTAGLLASLARRGDVRVIALDLNLAAPALHRFFDIAPQQSNASLLAGEVALSDCLQRMTNSVAIAPSQPADGTDAGLVHSAEDLAQLLAQVQSEFATDIILCDLPPLLQGDAAMSLSMALDAVLLVADSTANSAADITACERRLADQTAFLGVILNQYQGRIAP